MAILAVHIEDEATLPLNEFFDYDGTCYALSCPRERAGEICIDFEDFYDATVQTDHMADVPVAFFTGDESKWQLVGWYRKAALYKRAKTPSLFLEGNIVAKAADAVLLPGSVGSVNLSSPTGKSVLSKVDARKNPANNGTSKPDPQHASDSIAPLSIDGPGRRASYMVIEKHDSRYRALADYVKNYAGANAFQTFDLAEIDTKTPAGAAYKTDHKHYDKCIDWCNFLASMMMEDRCTDIRDIKLLALYAQEASRMKASGADGHYYLAMACHQLGQLKKGMKAIEKALRIEPDAADIKAMKANLLVSMGYYEAAAGLYHEAYLEEGDEDYLVLEGKAIACTGHMDQAYKVFAKVEDDGLLKEAGVNLKDMERKWPFIGIRGLAKSLFGKKSNM